MNGLDQLLRLRALREDRAARAAASAQARLAAARTDHARARAAIDRHDAEAARREARLHDAMISRGFAMTDLRNAGDRALHTAAERGTLAEAAAAAEAAISPAEEDASAKAHDLRRAILRHEKLRAASGELAATAGRQATARAEDEADDTGRNRA